MEILNGRHNTKQTLIPTILQGIDHQKNDTISKLQ